MITGMAFIEMGVGDVQTYMLAREDGQKVALFMKTVPAKEPGIYTEPPGFMPEESEVIMTFPSIEYAERVFDAFQSHVAYLKEHMSECTYVEKEKEDEA